MTKSGILTAVFATTMGVGTVLAQEDPNEMAMDVTESTCEELADATEMDRAFSLMFYYGYLAGRENIRVIDGSAVSGHLEQVRDFCNENPEATVIEAFVGALKPAE